MAAQTLAAISGKNLAVCSFLIQSSLDISSRLSLCEQYSSGSSSAFAISFPDIQYSRGPKFPHSRAAAVIASS